MKKVWQGVAIGVLGAAALQWINLGEQLVHAVIQEFKVGTPVLTAGIGMLKIFLILTGVAAVGGILSMWRLRGVSEPFARCARVATVALLSGAALWLGLIASPMVELVNR